jgi:hypothetical protein
MALIDFYVAIDDSRPTLRLKAIQDRVGGAGLASFMQGFAAPLLQERAHDRFESEGDDASGYWRPLAASTIARREKAGYVPIRINDRTGAMRAWVERAQGSIKGTKAAVIYEWPGTPTNRTTGRKLKVAQMGLANPWTWPRPVVAVDEDDLLLIISAMESWVGSVM